MCVSGRKLTGELRALQPLKIKQQSGGRRCGREVGTGTRGAHPVSGSVFLFCFSLSLFIGKKINKH